MQFTSTAHSRLPVKLFANRDELGAAAAKDIADAIRSGLSKNGHLRIIFASAPSQQEMLAHLVTAPDTNWQRVTTFHMDEYTGLLPDAPQRFDHWLKSHLFDRVNMGTVHLIEPDTELNSIARYSHLLAKAPIDIVCLGIGVNGHIAFNDPPVADFDDPLDVKLVQLDQESNPDA